MSHSAHRSFASSPNQSTFGQQSKPRLRFAINGFGRIGRNVLRAYIERGGYDFLEIVAINDIADAATLLHLLKYDSTHGRLDTSVYLEDGDKQLVLDIPSSSDQKQLDSDINLIAEKIQIFSYKEALQLPWRELAVDVVLECSGQYRSYAQAYQHVEAGAKQVVIGAAPFDDVDACVVYGVNNADLTLAHTIISSVSCTTQALVPLVSLLDEHYGIDSVMMTEIHAVTSDQTVLDQAHRDLRRGRASGQNIIPTTSSSIGALQRVMPHMHDKIAGYSIRVPTIDVAAIDVTVVIRQLTSVDAVNQMLATAAATRYQGIMQITDEPLVSSDFIHQPYSLIIDTLQTMQIGQQLKVFAWYDNEWGYTNRLLDMCLHLARQKAQANTPSS